MRRWPRHVRGPIQVVLVAAYTGQTLTFTSLKDSGQAAQLQIDHLVPLYNAWVSGAWAWTDQQRVTFAQDLQRPELTPVAGSVNFAKNHAGVETWSPVPERRCDYARAPTSTCQDAVVCRRSVSRALRHHCSIDRIVARRRNIL